jgi:hypothetical protein
MRKIFLASTALVAFGTVAANAADVSINGTTDWHYFNYDNDSNTGAVNGSYVDYDMDLDFKFTTTTDSGLALTMGAGVSEAGAMDDQYLDIAGDFGTIRLSDNLEGLADSAMDETVADNLSTLSPGLGMHGADLNATTVMYTLPSMNGLVVKAHFQDGGTTTKGDGTAFAVEYSADIADGSVKAQYISSTVDDTGAAADTSGTDSASLGLRVVMNDLQITASQHTQSDNTNTYDYTNNVIDVKYSGIENISISAFSLAGDDDLNNTYDYSQSAASVTYTIATGLTASVTMTDTEVTDSAGTVTSDDSSALNIKATF